MTGAMKSVVNSAVAADGGSLLLVLEWGDCRVETLFLNRSIASQGTAAYDTVTSDKRLLSSDERIAIAEELEQQDVSQPIEIRSLIGEFIRIPKRQGANAPN